MQLLLIALQALLCADFGVGEWHHCHTNGSTWSHGLIEQLLRKQSVMCSSAMTDRRGVDLLEIGGPAVRQHPDPRSDHTQ